MKCRPSRTPADAFDPPYCPTLPEGGILVDGSLSSRTFPPNPGLPVALNSILPSSGVRGNIIIAAERQNCDATIRMLELYRPSARCGVWPDGRGAARI